jgi:hypothetical protein
MGLPRSGKPGRCAIQRPILPEPGQDGPHLAALLWQPGNADEDPDNPLGREMMVRQVAR